MSHQRSLVPPPSDERAVFVGILPEAFGPGELPPGLTAEDLAGQIERGIAAMREAGVDVEFAGIGTDPDEAEAELRKRLAARPAGLALVGGGIRLLPDNTVLFERIVNVLVDARPGIRLSFNTNPENSLEALRRWLDR
ncbi:hypothetical protein [Glycomyces terrestris]|uniref:Uncharacterized protein n=1 Tax=Glycomyces terrestris TaxID=2493553 RepID=A0A426V130_9ACTN|nr:hypothetical protein [Glycomyces terrestris]RRS00562.1 hypothetical protein EIW28_08380 [Glycomyces terrestris]